MSLQHLVWTIWTPIQATRRISNKLVVLILHLNLCLIFVLLIGLVHHSDIIY
jgi:hypothetical protein